MRAISDVKSTLSIARIGGLGNAIAFSVATTFPLESEMPTMALVVVPEPAVGVVFTPVTGMAALVTLMAVPSLAMAETYLLVSAEPPETDWMVSPMAVETEALILASVEAAVARFSVKVDQSSVVAGSA